MLPPGRLVARQRRWGQPNAASPQPQYLRILAARRR